MTRSLSGRWKRELQRRRRASSQALREQERDRAREYMRERRAADPDAMRETLRAWLQRADRPCRYARAGCTEFAKVGRRACQRHSTSDVNRSAARKRARTKRRLAERQGWLCTWCTGQLAADLARTEIDHLIPKSSGVVIEDDWNLQALHEPCNRSKGGKITPRALDLAAAHGITIAGIAA